MDKFKLRIKLSSGAEFEAEGSLDFVSRQKAEFISEIANKSGGEPENRFYLAWSDLTIDVSGLKILKGKYPEITTNEAAILLIGANQSNDKKGISAIRLSRALKSSGYKIIRIDRLLSNEIRNADIVFSGTKRNRVYTLSPKGWEKTLLIAKKINYILNP